MSGVRMVVEQGLVLSFYGHLTGFLVLVWGLWAIFGETMVSGPVLVLLHYLLRGLRHINTEERDLPYVILNIRIVYYA
jgi:hypothetical protein